MFEEQTKMKFPGLSKECIEIAYKIGIYDEMQNKKVNYNQFKNCAKNKINLYNEHILKEDMKDMKKIKEYIKDKFERQKYFNELNTEEARTKFRIRTNMVDTKFNFRNKRSYRDELWRCDSCKRSIETQSHLLWCPTYKNLREGKNLESDKDLVEYIQQVLKYREDNNLER